LNIFNTEKSVDGHAEKSITSSFFNGIKFYLAFNRKPILEINL